MLRRCLSTVSKTKGGRNQQPNFKTKKTEAPTKALKEKANNNADIHPTHNKQTNQQNTSKKFGTLDKQQVNSDNNHNNKPSRLDESSYFMTDELIQEAELKTRPQEWKRKTNKIETTTQNNITDTLRNETKDLEHDSGEITTKQLHKQESGRGKDG